MPSLWVRFASRVVAGYLRCIPVERGKTRLKRIARWFLVARIDTGPWVRVSGLTDFEWNVIDRGLKEDRTLAILQTLIGPGMTVLDVGANIGVFALTAARIVGATGQVHAFEPTPSVSARLRENADLNGFDQLTVHQVALSDSPGCMPFYLSGEDPEANSLFASGDGRKIEVSLTTLDDHVARCVPKGVDLLKIDAEGAELRIIRGGSDLLGGPGAPAIILEINPATLRSAGVDPQQVRDALVNFGYELQVIDSVFWNGEVVENVLATKSFMSRSNA